MSKLRSGTYKTMHLPLFCKSHCATCSPVYVIWYHVTGWCKGPITVPFVNMQTLAVTFPTMIYFVFSTRQSNSGATVDGALKRKPTMWKPSPLYWLTGGSKWAFEVQNPYLYKRRGKKKRKKKGKQKHDFKLSLSIRSVLGLYETSGSLAVKADTLSSNRSAE